MKKLDLSHVKHFVLDECDRMLEEIGMFIYMLMYLTLRIASALRQVHILVVFVQRCADLIVALLQTCGPTFRRFSVPRPQRSRP